MSAPDPRKLGLAVGRCFQYRGKTYSEVEQMRMLDLFDMLGAGREWSTWTATFCSAMLEGWRRALDGEDRNDEPVFHGRAQELGFSALAIVDGKRPAIWDATHPLDAAGAP